MYVVALVESDCITRAVFTKTLEQARECCVELSYKHVIDLELAITRETVAEKVEAYGAFWPPSDEFTVMYTELEECEDVLQPRV